MDQSRGCPARRPGCQCMDYYEATGEAAFYGPKAISRPAMCSDANGSSPPSRWISSSLPAGLTYIGEDGQEHTPVVLHRAVTGTTERFMALSSSNTPGPFRSGWLLCRPW